LSEQVFKVFPIGVVLSDFKDTFRIPLEGAPARIVIYERYAEALKGIRDYSHLWVLCWLHLADTADYRNILRVRPLRVDPDLPETGVFASRTPIRPNPLSLTVVRLVSVHKNILTVDDLDVVDGTPVIDIKPYSPLNDSIPSAKFRPLPLRKHKERLIRTFFKEAMNFHAEACPGLALGTRMVVEALLKLEIDDVRDYHVMVCAETGGCIVDAVEAVMGATLGNGRLILTHQDRIALTLLAGNGEEALRVSLKSGFRVPKRPARAVQLFLEADAEEFLEFEEFPAQQELKSAFLPRKRIHRLE